MGHVLPAEALERIPELCRQYHVRRLDLFGSAADGRFDPARSDIDLLVTFEPMQGGSSFHTYFDFRDALMALFQREVDLVVESAIVNPYFRREVEEQRIQLFPSA